MNLASYTSSEGISDFSPCIEALAWNQMDKTTEKSGKFKILIVLTDPINRP